MSDDVKLTHVDNPMEVREPHGEQKDVEMEAAMARGQAAVDDLLFRRRDPEFHEALRLGKASVSALAQRRRDLAERIEVESRQPKAYLAGAAPIEALRSERDANAPPLMPARGEGAHCGYWESDFVRGARNSLDVWASCLHARFSGVGMAVPTLEAIFEIPRAEVTYLDEAKRRIEVEEMIERTSSIRPEARARTIALSVDLALWRLGISEMTFNLLLSLYPRLGPYQRPAYGGDAEHPESVILRAFRPREVKRIVGGISGLQTNRRIESLLDHLHREAIDEVAVVASMAPEILASSIRAIRVQNRPKKHRNAFQTDITR